MSDTPETDEELAYRAFGFYTMGGLPTEAIKPSFARELERERDRYQDQADALVEQLEATQERMIDAERELAQIRAIFPKILDSLKSGFCSETCSIDFLNEIPKEVRLVKEQLERERDALKEHISIMSISHQTANDEYFKLAVENENLERERDAAQKAMADARDILLDAMPDANAPTKILAEMIVAERDEARFDLEFRRGLYKLQTEQLNNANLRVERTRAYLEEIKSERDLWKLEAERWRDREMP